MIHQMREEEYRQRIQLFTASLHHINQQRQRIAWQRLLSVIVTFAAVYLSWNAVTAPTIAAIIIAGIAIFLYVVSKDTDAKNKASHLQRMIEINEVEIAILNHHFRQLPGGSVFDQPGHAYSQDLDLFGDDSLYQYLNRATSQQGQQLLATRLMSPLTKQEVETEAEAVKELTGNIEFRQRLSAVGKANSLTAAAETNTLKWLTTDMPYGQQHWSLLAKVYPLFPFTFLFLYIIDVVPAGVFYLLIFLCFLFAFSLSKKISPVYDLLSEMVNETGTFQQQLQTIESQSFSSRKMMAILSALKSNQGNSAAAEIKRLNGILNRFNVRLNTFAFYFVNTFLLWDLQQLLALNRWKQDNQDHIPHWFSSIAETEYSSSLATLAYNQPGWCFPVISDSFFYFEGSHIGHPLLPAHSRVNNSFSLEGRGKTAIITGSNMGGKSTFLRSLGVNVVLALMGAPVCAHSMQLSCFRLMSSMRIADNLAENTSTFYAELKKLKTIIEAVNRQEEVFILLDEILRGTNSIDRHTGSAALVKQFIHQHAVAVIATHDVELAKLESEFPGAIFNYHFDVQAEGSELYFDYKLKNGICRSMNASILMKNIGIELE